MDDVPLSLLESQKGYRRTIKDRHLDQASQRRHKGGLFDCHRLRPARGGSGRIMLRICRNIWIRGGRMRHHGAEGPLTICGRPPLRKGKRMAWRGAWSDAVICPAFDAAGRQPPACMGVRGPGPDHPKRARGTVESPGCPSPVSPTVAPYSPSARSHVLAIVVSLGRHGRSSVDDTFDQQGPDDGPSCWPEQR